MNVEAWRCSQEEIEGLVSGRYADPFSRLGPHPTTQGLAIRALLPDAETVDIVDSKGKFLAKMERRHPSGFFEALLPNKRKAFDYRFSAANPRAKWQLRDPYAFGPVLGPLDDHLLVEGKHTRLYDKLGAHHITHEGAPGVHFAVWAPHAIRVSVVGDFNDWDGRRHQMRKRIDSGIWEIFAPDVGIGTIYKYEIIAANGTRQPLKSDPFGFGAQLRPDTASVVVSTDPYVWSDDAHMAHLARRHARREPMSIYEVHLASWRRGHYGRMLEWDELADALIPYAVDLGFTHLELMPISEHPLDDSWGYQPVGLFAPTRRFGDPSGFARFVDRAHRAGLGVILDWVPAHFPTDKHGLSHFDGEALYEDADPKRGFHPDWNTAIYDFGRAEVANILLANALYWMERYHVDGLRVDAVASMLYLDYSRKSGEWSPNIHGGNHNLEAVGFLRNFNSLIYREHPHAMTIAEESTSWPGVSQPVDMGGLGFGFKWNMGWMHDTLDYMAQAPVHRRYHHNKMTFGLLYAFSENFVLPLSHDEVVHGKGSLITKMPGDNWQKFANLRAYYGFMWGHPGKKLLFMGQEFGQWQEWNFRQSLDWHLFDHPLHRGLHALVRDLNNIYRDTPALHARDCESDGFTWVVADDATQSVYAWLRFGAPGSAPVLVVSNFTPVVRETYRLGLPRAGYWREIMNSDAFTYGGSGLGNLGGVTAIDIPAHNQPASAEFCLPPLATLYFIYEPE